MVYSVCHSFSTFWIHPHPQTVKCYRKNPKNLDTRKNCCNHSKIWTKWLYHGLMCPNGADGMANSVDPDQEQSDLDLHCLPRPVCPEMDHYSRMITALILGVLNFRIFMLNTCITVFIFIIKFHHFQGVCLDVSKLEIDFVSLQEEDIRWA